MYGRDAACLQKYLTHVLNRLTIVCQEEYLNSMIQVYNDMVKNGHVDVSYGLGSM